MSEARYEITAIRTCPFCQDCQKQTTCTLIGEDSIGIFSIPDDILTSIDEINYLRKKHSEYISDINFPDCTNSQNPKGGKPVHVYYSSTGIYTPK